MEELLARIATKTGVQPDVARKAIGIIVSHLDRHAPRLRMEELFAAFPGAEELVGPPEKRGLLGKLMGDGLMGLYSDLTAAGLSLDDMQSAGEELMALAREKMGREAVDEITGSIPGLRQLL